MQRVPLADECLAAAALLRSCKIIDSGYSPLQLASVIEPYLLHRSYAYGKDLYAHLVNASAMNPAQRQPMSGKPFECLQRFLEITTMPNFSNAEAMVHKEFFDRAEAYRLRTGITAQYIPSLTAKQNFDRLIQAELKALKESK